MKELSNEMSQEIHGGYITVAIEERIWMKGPCERDTSF